MRRYRLSARFLVVVTAVAAALWFVPATAQARTAQPSTPQAGVYLASLQMTSAGTGWALLWTSNPTATTAPVPYLVPARTTTGARTWTTVAPPGSRPLLSTLFASVVLHAVSNSEAWLAVTAATSENASGAAVHQTMVFVTVDAGRTWTRSAPLNVPGFAQFLSVVGPDGWLLEDIGLTANAPSLAADYADVYRTTDDGLSWSLVAQTPPPPSASVSRSGLPVLCQKAGLAFATSSAGWLTGACGVLSYALRVTRDGGMHWSAQPLPIPADTCNLDGCEVFDPQFFGLTGFVTLVRAPAAPYFLVSQNHGRTWQTRALPAGGGLDPQITFFNARDGVLVSAGPQGSIGSTFYTTANAGLTWTAVPQGMAFTQLGTAIEFVSTRVGYAWVLGTDATGSTAPQMYETASSGRTWTPFTPLAA